MASIGMVLGAIATLAASGVPACLLPRRSAGGQRLTALLMAGGSALGLAGVALALAEPASPAAELAWPLPWGRFAVAIDAVSALFLVPVLVVPALGACFGLRYWRQADHAGNGRWLGLFYGWIAAAIALVVIARDGALFLIAWEVMALSAYFALVTEGEKEEVRRAGWTYFVATHLSTLCLYALFALWRASTGSLALSPAPLLSAARADALFVLAAVAFGCKAGLFPLHFWLPGAHAAAPSHLSAVMSGVLLNVGLYGIVRMTALLPKPPPWWGGALLAAGATSGVVGILFALAQHDLKRALAYSSVENVGIAAMGIGFALIGRARGEPAWIALGFGGGLLHILNHSLFKSLLFLGAGAVVHATGTRQGDRLGGLSRTMPLTTALFAIGAAAICALPPLNGFAGEWLLYVGFLRALGVDGSAGAPMLALAAVVLAAIGALALACFVKLLGVVFLGSPRSEEASRAHEPPAAMVAPMGLLAALCVAIGAAPYATAPLLEAATRAWAGAAVPPLAGLAPLRWLSIAGAALVALVVLVVVAGRLLPRSRQVERASTWGCGFAAPTARMQYTGSSFARTLVDLARWLLLPRRFRVAVSGLFARKSSLSTDVPDLVLDRGVEAAASAVTRFLQWTRRFQQGSIHAYLLYLLLAVVVLLVAGS